MYVMCSAWMAFTFFRDPFKISLIKAVLQDSILIPIGVVAMGRLFSGACLPSGQIAPQVARAAGGQSLNWTMDKYTESFYPEIFFGGFTQADGTVAFWIRRVNALIEPSSVLLDFGCGRGQHAEDEVSVRRGLQWLQRKWSLARSLVWM